MKTAEKYWHELEHSEVINLVGKENWQYVMDNYKQPDWCKYPGALSGIMGCWSLTTESIRPKISREFCKNCDEFIK